MSTVIGWSQHYSKESLSGLKSKRRGRRYLLGRTLTLGQEWQRCSIIVGENPKQLSLPFALWNRLAVMQLVKALFDIKMPILAAPSKRLGLSMISAISNQGLVKFEFIDEAMNADLLTGFMGRLIEDGRQKVFLILDNLKVHHAKRVTAWFAERDRIEVFYLPPYAPEINPDAYLNRDFKTELRSSDRAESKKGLLQKSRRLYGFPGQNTGTGCGLLQTFNYVSHPG